MAGPLSSTGAASILTAASSSTGGSKSSIVGLHGDGGKGERGRREDAGARSADGRCGVGAAMVASVGVASVGVARVRVAWVRVARADGGKHSNSGQNTALKRMARMAKSLSVECYEKEGRIARGGADGVQHAGATPNAGLDRRYPKTLRAVVNNKATIEREGLTVRRGQAPWTRRRCRT